MINVVWLQTNPDHPARGYWDQTLLEWLFRGYTHWKSPESFLASFVSAPHKHSRLETGAVVIIPGAYQSENANEINAFLGNLSWCLIIVTSDEQNNFPVDALQHPNKIVWVTYPNLNTHRTADRFIPLGYTPGTHNVDTPKDLDWFFAGQINSPSREACAVQMRNMDRGMLIESEGFAQGLEREDYLDNLQRAKAVPAPDGWVHPDSFRLYEALETGAVPISNNPKYWKLLFEDIPYPICADSWGDLRDIVRNLKVVDNNRVFAWWQRQKRLLVYHLEDDIARLTGTLDVPAVTVLIPTSSIPSHPSTEVIEQTLQSVLAQLPDCEIILMIDNLRPEFASRRKTYDEYTRRLLHLTNHFPVYPIIFDSFTHQANMTREALKHVRTPLVLFVEHDTPLDGDIPWLAMSSVIQSGQADVIRLMHEAEILNDYKHLMLDQTPREVEGIPLTRTVQWSQRPHLAATDYYRHIIDKYFPLDYTYFIEDRLYGVVVNDHQERGKVGWNDHRLWIYTPEGNMKRTLNLDGRQDDSKF